MARIQPRLTDTASRLAFRPHEIGLEQFPRIYRVFPFGCPYENDLRVYSMDKIKAHTHKYVHDPYYNSVCFNPKIDMFNHDGTPSDVLIHEYAHVIDFYYFDEQDLEPENWPTLEARGHGNHFYEALLRLGRPDLYLGYLHYYDFSTQYSVNRILLMVRSV